MAKKNPKFNRKTYRDLGFDAFGISKDVQKRKKDSFESNEKNWREEAKMKEEIRLKKLSASNGNQLDYAIQQILEKAKLGKDSFTASAYDLGFEDKHKGWREAEQLLVLLKDNECISEFKKIGNKNFKALHVNKERLSKYKNDLSPKTNNRANHNKSNKPSIRSIHLITESIASDDKIFVVLDERYESPIRISTRNNKGQPTYIRKLHNIAYMANAPGKKVPYTENTARDINNTLFRRKEVAEYMNTNKLCKPTLVSKSENGKYLVLKNKSLVETILIKKVPSQHQYKYIDKTM